MNDHIKAKPGKPGKHWGRRVRWRSVIRETRKTNRDAVQQIATAEIAMKRKHARRVFWTIAIRNALIVLAFAGGIAWKCGH